MLLFGFYCIVGCTVSKLTTTKDISSQSLSLGKQAGSEWGENLQAVDCRFTATGANVICGDLNVPEDRSDTSSQLLRLHIAIFRSFSDNPEPDPLIYLHGGPGAGVLNDFPFWYRQPFESVLYFRDLIVFDQRGTGFSQPRLSCPGQVQAFYESLTQDQRISMEAWFVSRMEDCQQYLFDQGYHLNAYASVSSAEDINDLRKALGIRQVNLYGASYGSRLALTVMREYQQQGWLRSVILDSVYPPQVDLFAERAGNAQRAFESIFTRCAQDAVCNNNHPNLRRIFYGLIDELDAKPVELSVFNPITGREQLVVLNANRLIEILYRASYDSAWIAQIPQLLYETRAGDYKQLTRAAETVLTLAVAIDEGVYYAVQCQDEANFSSLVNIEQHLGDVHEKIAQHFATGAKAALEFCRKWQLHPLNALENQPVLSEIPALILVGDMDPITPPRWAEHTAQYLNRSYLFRFPQSSHGVLNQDGCAQVLVGVFLNNPWEMPSSNCVLDQ